MRDGERLPVLDVALHRSPALGVEALDAVVLDLELGGEPELLLDLDLDRQAVAVPAALAGHVLAPHRVEAGIEVLEEAGPHMVDPGSAVRGGRTLVEHPFRGARPAAQRLAEHVLLAPTRQHRLFERDEVERRINRVEHGGNVTGGPLGGSRSRAASLRRMRRCSLFFRAAGCAACSSSPREPLALVVARPPRGSRRSRTTARCTRSGARASTVRPRRCRCARPIVAMASTANGHGLLDGRVRRRRSSRSTHRSTARSRVGRSPSPSSE